MTTNNSDGSNPSLFETFSNKLNTVRSNRSLVAANQQLRVQLAFTKAEINRLQNEIVDLQKRITGLESTSDEERIEMIVRKRLQQRVQHLKSIASRTVQYMEKTKTDFDHAASRLDHAHLSSNFDDGATYVGECSQTATVPLSCGTGNEIVGCRVQRPSTLEVVEEDVYGEMDENDVISDKDLIMPITGDRFKRSPDGHTSSRNSRRETFFVKKESHESENDVETSFVEVSGTDQMVSSFLTQNHEDPPAVLTELIAPTTTSLPKTPTVFSKLETTTTRSRSRSFKAKTPHDENTPAKNSQIMKPGIVTHSRKKRKISINGTPKRCKKSSENNTKAMKEINKVLITPTSTSTGILSVANLNQDVRCKRVAAAKISSFKEPNLVSKMRNTNVN
ncbi:unnamed protein product [Cercopithifilaria johnstoni]|uniref:Shugoshin C-terminal domain-containing protein n=1 Tax=Cercopithifilaria johnstoni TaxID=2874296 RepID=A0A8J2MLB9_9BILA|nr:unnamed protein product [Cercopithifilaria johnstoni]